MTITLPLDPREEAKILALAREKGISADQLVREALNKFLSESAAVVGPKQPTRSLRGLLSKYGPAPSAEEIDQNRTEMLANFPSADL